MKMIKKLFLLAVLLVFSTAMAWATDVKDQLTKDDLAATGTSYTNFTNVQKNTAVYAGRTSVQNSSIGMKRDGTNGAGIFTTTSGGVAKSLSFTWTSTSNRTLQVWGKNSAYSLNDTKNQNNFGTKIAEVTYASNNTNPTLTLNSTDEYEFILIIPSSTSMLSITDIEITWEVSGGGSNLTASDLTITNQSTALSFDLYNNNSAQVINYTTSSTGEVTITPASPTSYFSYVHDATNKTITVTPLAVTSSAQTITISQAADDTYEAGTKTFTVSVADSSPLANIAALTAKSAGSYTVALNNALVTYVNGTNAYLEDASGAVLLYHCNNNELGLAVGDKITGTANVTLTVYKNLPEVTAITLVDGYTKTSGNTVTPTEVTIATLLSDYTSYISRYVKIVGATVTSAFSSKNSTIEQGGSSIVLRDQNSTATLTATVNDIVTVTAHPSIFDTTQQIAVYEQSQIVVSKVDPTITFNNGTVRVGSTLDLTTLFSSNSTGAVTYSITAGDSYATLSGSTLTGTAEGSVTVKAEQAESSSYNAGEATATITVNPALVLSSIAITTAPTKTTYDEGETFDPTGMVVTATYTDNSTDTVTGYTYSPNGALTTSDTEITVSYTENAVTKTAKQAITVNEVVDYATLPFEYDGNGTGTLPTGFTCDGLGTYNSSPKMQFNGTGDWAILKINERPGTLTFDIKGNSFSSGTFKVQTSEDGTVYTDLESYTELGNTQNESFDNIGENVRYIKWIYTNKVNGNVALGNIALAKYVDPATTPVLTLSGYSIDATAAETEGTLDITYQNLAVADMNDFGIQYYDSNNDEISEPAWIEVLVAEQDPTIGEGYVVSYYIEENNGEARNAYFKVYAMDNSTNLVYSDLVTVTQAKAVVNPIPADWVETNLADLTENDVFVIVAINGAGDYYAMSNDNGTTSAPAAVNLTGSIPNNVKWNIGGNATDGYIFYPNGSTSTWLYCTNTNNGLRVGNNSNNAFIVDDENNDYLYNTATSRWIGIYNSQDWRCYALTNQGAFPTNIKDQTFKFYKKVVPSTVEPTINVTARESNGRFWATFYNADAQYILPAGAQAFTMNADHELYLVGKDGSVIPDNTAVIIIADMANLTLTQNNVGDGTIHGGDNILQGSSAPVAKSSIETGKKPYVLGIPTSNSVGFYEFTGTDIPANKAYYVE